MTAAEVGARLRAVLDELQDELRAAGVAELPPPLTEPEIEAATRGLPFELPVEAVTFYTWHNGLDDANPTRNLPMLASPGPLDQAVRYTLGKRAQTVEYVDDPDRFWSPMWFMIGSFGPWMGLTLDCSGPGDLPSPVLWPTLDEDDDFLTAPSWADHVALWVQLWRDGLYTYDPHHPNGPRGDFLDLPPDLMRKHLA